MSSMPLAYEIYVKELFPLNHGFPVYFPRPLKPGGVVLYLNGRLHEMANCSRQHHPAPSEPLHQSKWELLDLSDRRLVHKTIGEISGGLVHSANVHQVKTAAAGTGGPTVGIETAAAP